ncbi:MAG: Oxidoreductase family, NAD-binding Rossmann fold [Clostridia bacterium]|nr:Oxidoreductase family, NAD-binding Rossmann fold [Clostridia bacterium]
MSKLKIGVFGAYRGMTMVNVIIDHPYATLVAVCDKHVPSLENCKKLTEEKGMKVEYFTDFDSFIQCDMDAVILANYANEHAPFAIRYIFGGRIYSRLCFDMASDYLR